MTMEIEVRDEGSIAVAAVRGSLDGLTAESFEERFAREIDGGRVRWVVDLAALDYVSSAGLRALLGGMKSARSGGGDLRLAAAAADVERVLDLSGFTSILKLFATLEEALGSYAE